MGMNDSCLQTAEVLKLQETETNLKCYFQKNVSRNTAFLMEFQGWEGCFFDKQMNKSKQPQDITNKIQVVEVAR